MMCLIELIVACRQGSMRTTPTHTQQGSIAQQSKRVKPRMVDSRSRRAAAADLVTHLARFRSSAAEHFYTCLMKELQAK